ncbi:MAG: gamma-glutamyl-gamma-aminobutyrate hydrolase family protein [Candidatus Nanopelagicales bacterium]|nr:gamma-glutamyl-gamma-aminobutyrate hydrolase family protein [Candidatus Nanopelagicales bacterium]MCF8537291.1 gamma-glutamyl-gamma-aminobutyrate hydrolase family protein [Candidatus Nanopelagicales bacterium]MCF8542622.1 gamma-glutamyl-gamma-aminobutyrate hydrolase family protein [Candidatus Nanopelagicales bacterium]MCF8557722.1 gamma-glutamyl-gamma-aminobutyrate hydrolase family protein [Candidatus Nanopelagicales bacterium]
MTVVGVTTYQETASWGAWHIEAAVLPRWYVDLFQQAGAHVALLPPDPDPQVVDRLDGLVLVGGADVDARLYGDAPHATADVPRETRDASELALYSRARERDMPVLGICRGLQIMAVAHGGRLIQNLPDVDGTLVHRERPGEFVDHDAVFAPGTLGGRIFGTAPLTVNSSHHQAVAEAGSLTVCGHADDGTIEACEDPAADFCLGVQWHPEHPDRRSVDRPLIAAFVDAAERFAARSVQ